MTKKIKWRLSTLPTPDEVRELVKDKIITQDEAREILFSQEDEKEADKKSLESEIKFLRELVEKLSNGRTQIVETIREVQVPWRRYPWFKHYDYWCSNSDYTGSAIYLSTGGSGTIATTNSAQNALNFSAINTI